MATEKEKQNLLGNLQELFQFKDTELIDRKEWGVLNFEQIRHDVESVFRIATELVDLPLEHLPSKTANQVSHNIAVIAKVLREMDTFSIDLTGIDSSELRKKICERIKHESGELVSGIAPFLPYLASMRGDLSENVKAIKFATEEAKQTADEAKKILHRTEEWIEQQEVTLERKQDTADDIVRKIRETSSGVGVERFAPAFRDEANDLGNRSKIWLWVTGGLAITTIAVAIYFYFYPAATPSATGLSTVNNVLSKAAIIAILFTGTIWCGRIYRTLAHQATVNKHRALSLETFQTFVDGTEDPQVKDAVLMAATNTVFANVPTGYVEPKSDQGSRINFDLSKFNRSNSVDE